MENSRRHIIVGYAVFTLFFLSSVFIFSLFRVDMLSAENRKKVEFSLATLQQELRIKYGLKGSFDEGEISALFMNTLKEEPRLLVIAVYSDDYGILKAVGKSKEYLENAQFRDYAQPLRYKKPLGTSELNLALVLTYQNGRLPVKLSALYISFSNNNSTALLWEILALLLGFFGLTLAVIIIMAIVFRQKKSLPEGPGARQAAPPERAGSLDAAGDGSFGNVGQFTPAAVTPAFSKNKSGEMFVPDSGMVKSEYFVERLDNEIERAASFDQDLSLIMIRLVKDSGFSLKRDFTGAIHHFFPLHDLAFEYQGELYALVVPDEGIDETIKTAKLLYKELADRRIPVFMGISSRNGRLPSALLLIEETQGALAEAQKSDHSPIVAFRPDPDKFKDSLST